jgi:Rod binding domain-containing protein
MRVHALPPQSAEASPAPADAKTRKAAEAFAAVALNELLQPMFDTADMAGGFFGGGAAEQAFKPMLVSEIAKQIAAKGGLGLVQPVLQQMLRLQEASR